MIASWGNAAELASFAKARHGYENSDGGFGVMYPDDLDEYQRQVEKHSIPQGSVELYGDWGLPNGYEFTVSEEHYLRVLAEVLKDGGFTTEASDVERLARNCS